MTEIIKEVLRKYPTANLASESTIEEIADKIEARFDELLQDKSNIPKAVFTQQMLYVFKQVAQQLENANQLDAIKVLYEELVQVCKYYNNGQNLLGLSEALSELIATAAEATSELESCATNKS
jgi:hypothetical protein